MEDLTDNEREEQLRRWWSDNWAWIIGGVALGLALLAGWQYWQRYQVQTAEQVVWLDTLLTQIEKTMGYEVGRIGIEAQIENALGLINVDAIAAASPRVETVSTASTAATARSMPVATMGGSLAISGTAWRCMLEPISARLASSCSRKGISDVDTEMICLGDTSM